MVISHDRKLTPVYLYFILDEELGDNSSIFFESQGAEARAHGIIDDHDLANSTLEFPRRWALGATKETRRRIEKGGTPTPAGNNRHSFTFAGGISSQSGGWCLTVTIQL